MNFDYSDDERALQEQARRLLTDRGTLALTRSLLDGQQSGKADALWREVTALGWAGAAIPEAYGGHGLGPVALCALAEEIGRAAAPLPFLPSLYLAAEALMLAGSEEQKRRWLPALATGDIIGTALLEGDITLRNGLIDGTASPVPYGLSATLAVLYGAGTDLLLVDLSAPGIDRQPLRTLDDSVPHAAITFHDVPAERLGPAGQGAALARRLQARAAIFLAFEQLGGSDACLAMALAYARERRAFGRVIGGYQAIKHKLADIFVKNELARSNAYYGAWALTAQDADLEAAASTARLSAIEAYDFAAAENIQVHGGMGFTWEADCHLHYRRARLLAHALAGPAHWRDRLVAALDLALSA